MKKNLFCEECDNYPDLIEESVGMLVKRKWNGTEYESYYTEEFADPIPVCQNCGSLLIDSPQEELHTNEPKTVESHSPNVVLDMPRELSGQENILPEEFDDEETIDPNA